MEYVTLSFTIAVSEALDVLALNYPDARTREALVLAILADKLAQYRLQDAPISSLTFGWERY